MGLYKARRDDISVRYIGADPEFEVIQRGRVISADTAVHDTDYGQLGRDGDGNWGNQVELRPNPAVSNDDLVANVRGLFRQWVRSYPRYRLGVKGDRFSIGGHIHFGFTRSRVFRNSEDEDLVTFTKILDFFYGKKLSELSGRARLEGGYQILADDPSSRRCQNWGFEYRVPPSSFYAHPEFCSLIFKTSLNLGKKYWGTGIILEDATWRRRYATAEIPDYVQNGILNEEETRRLFAYIYYYGEADHNDILASWLDAAELPATDAAPEPVVRRNTIPGLEIPRDQVRRDPFPAHEVRRNLNNGLTLVFRDDWNNQLQDDVIEAFRRSRWPRNRSVVLNGGRIIIILFGLAEERGDEAISCSYRAEPYQGRLRRSGFTYLNYIYPNFEGDSINFGLSRAFRMARFSETGMRAYLKAIKKTAELVTWLRFRPGHELDTPGVDMRNLLSGHGSVAPTRRRSWWRQQLEEGENVRRGR